MSDSDDIYYDSDEAGSDFTDFDDDDDVAYDAPNGKGKDVDLSVSFKSFSPDELRVEIDREANAITSILGVDRNLALIFLLHYRWNRDKLIEQYSDSPLQILSEVGHLNAEELANSKRSSSNPPKKRFRRSPSPVPPMKTCGVCFDEILDSSDLPRLNCDHFFCHDCWDAYLSNSIKSEGQCSIRCMGEKCKAMISEDFVKCIADEQVHQRWQDLLAQSFVAATSSLRFCPAPSCTETVQCSIGSSTLFLTVPTVTCSLGHSFCFGCGIEDGHAPVICKIAERWLTSKDDSGTNEWLNAHTRKCPKCTHNIEKAGGCNRMMCRHCMFQFCWVCLKDWSVHGYNRTVCNSYEEPEPTPDMDEAKVKLARWSFYYDRFNNHEVSAKLEQELVERAEEKVVKIQKNSDLSWIETRFMQHAVDELTKCRRTLKWTYAMAHFLANGNKKQIFEDLQADLEKAVEQLSQLVDEPIPVDVSGESGLDRTAMIKELRQRVLDKTVYVQKRHEILLADIATGLAEGHWDWTIPIY